jgi:hypothetical protein
MATKKSQTGHTRMAGRQFNVSGDNFNEIYILCDYSLRPSQVAARSKEWECGPSLAGIIGSNPTGSMDVSCECCVLSDRGLWVRVISRPEESYRE